MIYISELILWFHYLCSQCYAAQHSYVPLFSTTWPNLFSNTFSTVGNFWRVLQSSVSIRFSQHDRTVTHSPNNPARAHAPLTLPHGFFEEKGFTKSFRSSHLLSGNLAKTLQVLVYDNFASVRRSTDFEHVRKATNQGGVCRDLSCQKRMCGRGKGARARAG